MPSTAPILLNGTDVTPLPLFGVSDIKRKYRVEAEQGSFSTNLVEFGEGIPEAASITLRGPIFGSTPQDYLRNKDELYRKLIRKGNRLFLNGRTIPLGVLSSDTLEFEDAVQGRVDYFAFEFKLLSPFWSGESRLITTPIVPGSLSSLTLSTVESLGNAPTFPIIQMFVRQAQKISIQLNGRTLTWAYFNSSGQRSYYTGNFKFNYETGLFERWQYNAATGVVSNLTDIRDEIEPDSQVAPLNPGTNIVRVRLAGRDVSGENIYIRSSDLFY